MAPTPGPWRFGASVALAIPVLACGLSFPSTKAALGEFGPMTLAFGRFVLAGLVLGIVQKMKMPEVRLLPRDRWPLGLSVFLGITLYFLCENNGVKLIPASAASLIIAGIPILTLVAQWISGQKALGLLGSGATLVSIVGIVLLVGTPGAGTTNPWGYGLMLGAALAWVGYLFTMRPLQQRYPNLAVTAWQMLLGALSLFPFALAELPQWRWPSVAGWANLVFQGLVCSAASYLLYNHALERLGVRTASLAVNLIPVVTAVAAFAFLGEVLGPWQWVGGALVLGAVIATAARSQR